MREGTKLPSAWQLGTDVYLPGKVAGVQFTDAKVHYMVQLAGEEVVTVDSVSVCRDPEPSRQTPEQALRDIVALCRTESAPLDREQVKKLALSALA